MFISADDQYTFDELIFISMPEMLTVRQKEKREKKRGGGAEVQVPCYRKGDPARKLGLPNLCILAV